MTKKLHIVHVISNLGVGGAEGVLYELLSHLDTQQFTHTVLYFRPGPYVRKIEALGIKTYYVRGLWLRYDPFLFIRCYQLIRTLKPDCLHTLLWAANFIGRLIAPFLGIAHVEVLHNNIDQNGFIRMFFDRLTASRAGKIIAISDGVASSLVEYAPWFAKSPVSVIKNGISWHSLTDHDVITKESFGLSDAHFIIGTVGRFERVKNYGLLLTAFALLYDDHSKARLVMLGQGSQERFLRTRAYDLGIDDRVIFVTGKDAQPYYQLFDCFVLSSYKEGISMALLEAMNNGVPSVVTSTSPLHDVIQNEDNGFLVPSGDPEKLAQAIDRLIKSRALRRKLGDRAKETVKQYFGVQRMVQEYADLYHQVILGDTFRKSTATK